MSRENYAELKNRLLFIRSANTMSKSAMARVLRLSPTYVGDLESGKNTNISESLAQLISLLFDINEQWILAGTGPVFSTSVSALEEKVPVMDLVMRNIERTERMLEIISGSPHHDQRIIYHLARFQDGNCLLITGMLPYDDKSLSAEITDIRDELQQREIPIYQLQVDEHWFAELTIYPRKERLQELFMHHDARPLGEQNTSGALSSALRYYDLTPATDAGELNIYDLLKKAGEVLEAPGIYRSALASNIIAFHHSIKMSEDLAAVKSRMDTFETFEAQTNKKFDELAQLIKILQEENQTLKLHRSSEEDPDETIVIDASSSTDQASSRKTES